MRIFRNFIRTGFLLVGTGAAAFAVPFNDSIEFAADLGSEPRLHRMSDPRVATLEDFEFTLGMADESTPLFQRTGSLWFKWTAPSAGTYHVVPIDVGDLVDVYRVTNGNPGAHIEPVSNDDSFFNGLSFTAAAGEQILIRHMGWWSDPFFSFGPEDPPVGFLLRKEQTGVVTELGSRKCIAGHLTSFGDSNSESYRWTVPVGGSYLVKLDNFSSAMVGVELIRNGVPVPGFVFDAEQDLLLAAGDSLEIILDGDVGYAQFSFFPEEPPSSDLGSVTDITIPSKPEIGSSWTWTAPADGFVRLELETTQGQSFSGGLYFGEEMNSFGREIVDVGLADADCETLGYRVKFVTKVEVGVTYEFFEFHPIVVVDPNPFTNFAESTEKDPEEPEANGCIDFKFFTTAVTMEERIDAATVNLDLGTAEGLAAADAHLAAALAMDSTHPAANVLRGITRLALLERDPAYAAFLQSLNITGAGTSIFDSNYALTEDVDGQPVFPVDANATERIAALKALISPRLVEVRGYLEAAVENGDDRVYLASTGSFVIDEADVLAIKATMNIIQALVDLLSVYDLGGSLNAIVQLERDRELELEHALAQFPTLLSVADSAAIAEFKIRMMDANTQLCAALVKSAGNRVICGKHLFPPVDSADGGEDFLGFLEGIDEIAKAFLGPVDIGGETIDLSAWNASSASLRDLLPDIRGNRALGLTAPDPTLGGIFPRGDTVNSPIEGILGFSDPAGFSFWIQSFVASGLPPFLSGFDDDADGDGDSNGKEYFFASNPDDSSVVSQGPVSTITPTPEGRKFRVSFVRRIGTTDVRYVVAVSENLTTWDYSEAGVSVVGSPTPIGDGQGEIVTVEIDSDLSGSKYVRIHAAAK